jgi:type I restriction enzyme R subunit
VRVGLTATPAAHTVALFGEPVFRYGVEQAILDGWLVDYEPVAIHSNVRINGVFLKEGEHIGKIDTQTGVEGTRREAHSIDSRQSFPRRTRPSRSKRRTRCGFAGANQTDKSERATAAKNQTRGSAAV